MNTIEQIGLSIFNSFINLCIGVGVFVGGTEIVKRLDTIKANTDGTLHALQAKNDVLQGDKDDLVDEVHAASTKPATRQRRK